VAAPGTYTITEQVQSGWMPTTPNPQTVTVQPGQTVNLTFGNKEVGRCDLTIRKSVSPNPVQSGQPVTVTLTVMNVGNGACGPDTVVQDPPTSGLTVPSQSVSVNPPGPVTWSCNISNNGLTCVSASTIPAGYTATFTFTATVTAPAGSQIQNCATVSNPNDINSQNNQSCVTISVTGITCPDLAEVLNTGFDQLSSSAPPGRLRCPTVSGSPSSLRECPSRRPRQNTATNTASAWPRASRTPN